MVARPGVAAELAVFAKAVRERFGYDAHRDLCLQRAEPRLGAPQAERPREGLAGVARVLAAERLGRDAYEERERARERARQVEQERLSPRPGRGMRM